MNTTSRVEGSHAALKCSLSSLSGTLYAAGQRISYRDAERSTQHSIVGATENLFTVDNQEEDGTTDKCSCTVRSRYLLPCSHQIQLGVPLDVTQIHPRWRVQVSVPVLEVTKQNLGTSVLSQLKDPVVLLNRKGRPRGTRRLQTSAEIVQKAERVRHCANHQPDAVDNNDLDEDGDGEEDVEHIVGGSSLTEVWDDVLASL
ncbi:hypothetical protein V1522DRAFT_437400 [Lipomyces starkeyi]